MRGIVVHHEHRIGCIVIRDPEERFIVAKLLDIYEVERGDAITGDFHTVGKTTLFNEVSNQDIDVEILSTDMTEDAAIELIVKNRN
ncbi:MULTISPECIES: hypothetical protein [Dickeya]|uniref:Uncharacterized protein n=2 Tax=Dickeya chrysanthemi TaxID=556 RepID=C6CJC9_DICC1|nr:MULTISPECIES: hypothetical protein [Dickeya]ACT07109.1 hypothetical protein Dd1591_2267 [Dickeya chrysanthemi Ech1591]MBX9444977.1 hypothetical protein [Dickeya chrysanthemi]MCA7007514.1 hypothetical protein [Dickeya chrysanthemi]TYL44631.1 hypothetical protein FDP13_00915 [Dickeya sp. ws52]WJM84073.1 hypothetical protein QUF31_12950 [Dickeya chrysanthemi]